MTRISLAPVWSKWTVLSRFKKLVLGCSMAVLCVTGSWVEWADWPNYKEDVLPEKADAMVVLGGGGSERPRQAWKLAQEKRAQKVIVTGDGDSIVNALNEYGLDPSALIHETAAKSTIQNAKNVAPLLSQLQAETVILVTSWSHAHRAMKTFKSEMPNVKFFCSFEPRPTQLDPWEYGFQRRERLSSLYHLFVHGIWCF